MNLKGTIIRGVLMIYDKFSKLLLFQHYSSITYEND